MVLIFSFTYWSLARTRVLELVFGFVCNNGQVLGLAAKVCICGSSLECLLSFNEFEQCGLHVCCL